MLSHWLAGAWHRAVTLPLGGAVLACLLLGGSSSSAAQSSQNYMVHGWQTEDGLPQNTVTAIVQTRDSYLWVGTYSGLARFDGVRFVVFDSSNTPQMHSSRVTGLFEAADGTLWIGHETGELTRYLNGRFEAVAMAAKWSGGKIYDIGSDETGDIWLMNSEGLLARARDGLVLTPQPGSATKLVEMATSRHGTIWVARDGRVSVLEQGQLIPLQFDEGLTNHFVMGIGASRDGGLWMTMDGRLRKWKNHRWTEDLGRVLWNETPIHRLIETKSGLLVAATSDHGFYLVFPDGSREPLQFSRGSGFPSDWVISLCEDREGSLWAGTGGAGLARVRAGSFQTVAPPDSWQGRAVLSVTTGRDGAMWVGTEGAGLYRLHDGNWENFGARAGILNPYVWAIAEDPRGAIWAGTWGGGLWVRRGERFEPAPGLASITPPIPALLCARSGGLWVGTGIGLMRYQEGKVTWYGQDGSSALNSVRAVIEDVEDTVWFGMSGGGLGCLKNGETRRYRKPDGLASDVIQCLHLDAEGALWIGTFGGGLNRLKGGSFATIGRQQGLPNGIICHIEEDGRGYFWMSSHGGIIRVVKAELDACADGRLKEVHCLTFGMGDGLPTSECSGGLQPAGCKTADGRLWFSTSKGLVTVDPRMVKTNSLPPPVVIESLLVDDRLVAEGAALSAHLKIPPGSRRFEFQYTGLSFAAPEKVRFKRRLEGLEDHWTEVGTKRLADYSYLPPGEYTFHVTACNNDEVWNETGALAAFIVLPFFWQTAWFRFLAGAVVVASASGLVWFDTQRRMRQQLELAERQRAIEHERARIAHDIHDDLGAHLTQITMLSESARSELDNPRQAEADLNQIYSTARELTRAMDEIVWAVNPRHDTLEAMVNYLEKFTEDFLGVAGIRHRLDMPLQFPAWALTSDVRHNIFLAFKEALNNVVKHAGASEVRVSLVLDTATLELTLEDDGCGFMPEALEDVPATAADRFAGGNGLENMRGRLAEIGGRCSIRSAPGKGTKVVFTVPVKKSSRN